MARRRRLEQIEGIAFDAALIAVAAWVSEDAVQSWLFEHPAALYHGLAGLHVVTCPALLVAIMAGYGQTQALGERGGSWPLGWAAALLFAGSFMIPGVLGLLFDPPMWEYLVAIFAPVVVVFPLWVGALVIGERRGWSQPAAYGAPKPWWTVQALALLSWAYLLWLETMLLVAAGREGPLVEVGLPIGVLINYVPVRAVLYYVRERSRWERYTAILGALHLLYRLVARG